MIEVDHTAPGIGIVSMGGAAFLYFIYRHQSRTFQDVGMWHVGTVSVTGLASPEQVPTLNPRNRHPPGARRDELTRMFVGHGFRLAAVGVAFGLAAAAVLMRLMSSLLFEVKPFDPVTLLAASIALMGAAVLASYLPAIRASAVNPLDALRSE